MKKYLVTALYPDEACPMFALQLAMALKSAGNEVYAVAADEITNKAEWIKELSAERLVFIKLKKSGGKLKRLAQKFINPARFLLHKRKIIKNVKGVRFDAVIFTYMHGWNPWVKKFARADVYSMIVHDPIPHSDEKKNRKGKQARQIASMNKLIVLSKAFVPVCVKEYGFAEKDIIYIPHSPMNYNPGNLRTPYGVSPVTNFLFFGRITKYKGIGVLFEAFARLEEKYPQARLTVAGRGDFSEFEQRGKSLKNAELDIRYIADEEIPRFFTMENLVCVLPYLDATQSGIISIAMEYGAAVIASDTGGLKEQLNDGKNGIFCEAGNAGSLYEAMERAHTDRNLIREEGEKNFAYGKTLGWEAGAEKLIAGLNR